MKSPAVKFLLIVLAITLACAAGQTVFNQQAPAKFIMKNGYVLLGIFAVSVSAIHLFLLRSAQGRPQAFVTKFLGVTVFKFMFYMLLLVVYLLFTEESKMALILHFLFYYAVFTVLEASMLYSEMEKMRGK